MDDSQLCRDTRIRVLSPFRGVLEGFKVGQPMERYQVAAWICWAIPLLVTEPFLQLRKLRGATRPSV